MEDIVRVLKDLQEQLGRESTLDGMSRGAVETCSSEEANAGEDEAGEADHADVQAGDRHALSEGQHWGHKGTPQSLA
jgi:hypothetical protein